MATETRKPTKADYIERLKLVGIEWKEPELRPEPDPQPESDPQPEKKYTVYPSLPLPTPLRAPRDPRIPRSAYAAEPDDEPESESEMMGQCNTNLTGEIAEENEMVKKGVQNAKNITPVMAAKLDEEAFKIVDLKLGDRAGKHDAFVPWRFLTRYGELYVGKTNTPIVKPYFELEAVLENQNWDVFYLYDPEDLNANPILFAPTCQLEAYLRKINKKNDIALKIPDGGNEVKFARQFGMLSTPQPRYVGRTNGIGSLERLAASIPLPESSDDPAAAPEAEREEFANLLIKIKESWVGGKGNGKGSKARKKAVTRYENRKAWGHATKRVQRYLGLRGKAPSVVSDAGTSSMSPLVASRSLILLSSVHRPGEARQQARSRRQCSRPLRP